MSQPGVDAADYGDRRSAPHLRKKMLGDDKTVRSSLAIKDVLGYVNADDMSRAVQDRCGASHLRVDASSKSIYGMSTTSCR